MLVTFLSTKKLRVGITLIETIVIMALSAVLTGIVITGIASLYHYNRSASTHSDLQMAAQQMMITLRQDIHRASRAVWNGEKDLLELEMPELSVITYREELGRWVRVEAKPNSEATIAILGLDSSFACLCSQQEIPAGDLLRISFVNQFSENELAERQSTRTVRFDIDAMVGRDKFLLHQQ